MKLLTVLGVLQTAGIAALILIAVNPQPPELQAARAAVALPVQNDAGQLALDEDQLRRVVREELHRDSDTADSGNDNRAPAVASSSVNQRIQLELVQRQLERYRGQGAMSPVEMSDLHTELAKLEPAARREMLIALVGALNTGEIRGAP